MQTLLVVFFVLTISLGLFTSIFNLFYKSESDEMINLNVTSFVVLLIALICGPFLLKDTFKEVQITNHEKLEKISTLIERGDTTIVYRIIQCH